ncbi:MAG TPA: hypothetical protein VN176_01060 [Verrucomicrobiae bacterium]|jgi:hypothetical protein|nr:hypothetical protein [Verrucomicrobiae bacterium]
MRNRNLWCLLAFTLVLGTGWSQQTAGTVPVSLVVTVEAKHGKEVPVVYKEDVRVLQGKDRLQVTDWVPLQGSDAGLELFLLIDDATDPSVGLQLDDLRKFINAQPATTAIGVGYMRNGTVDVRQDPTADHAQAAKALRLTLGSGGSMSSPYLSVTDLIKRWPPTPRRHEIFMVTSGIDELEPGPSDTYLAETIDHTQRAGVQVYSIYASRAGHFGHTFWRVNFGQSNLSQLADATGAESYFQGVQTPISFGPFLDEFAERLRHQFRLTFLIKAGEKGELRHIKVETEVPHAELATQDRVYIPAAK